MSIARDATNQGTGSAPQTLSHTCTGSNLTLWAVGVTQVQSNPTLSMTYNGVAMTLVSTLSTGGVIYGAIFKMVNPPTGAHNIVLTVTGGSGGSNATAIISLSLTGCDQNTQPDISASGDTVITVSDKDWGLSFGINGTGTAQTVGTNSTVVGTHINLTSNGDLIMCDTNGHGAITPAGSFTMGINNQASQFTIGVKQFLATFNVRDTQATTDRFTGGTGFVGTDTQGSQDSGKIKPGFVNLSKNNATWVDVSKT